MAEIKNRSVKRVGFADRVHTVDRKTIIAFEKSLFPPLLHSENKTASIAAKSTKHSILHRKLHVSIIPSPI